MNMNDPSPPRTKILSWRDLEVWQTSHELVLEIYKVTKHFPPEERFRLVDQLCRAAASIPTNIAEGKGRFSVKQYANFVGISRGSLQEVKYLLLLAKDLGFLSESEHHALDKRYDKVGRMLHGLHKALRRDRT